MARTVFVNPRRRKARKSRKSSKRRVSYKRAARKSYGKRRRMRRNAGIAPFVQNPMLFSPNPRRRRAKRRNGISLTNPLTGLNLKSVVSRGLTYGGGAAVSVAANTLFLNSITNFWARNGARFGAAVLGASMLRGEIGAATAGSMLYPMMQELAAKFLGGASKTEADLEGLAADLEGVMGELDESDFADDLYVGDDEDILS